MSGSGRAGAPENCSPLALEVPWEAWLPAATPLQIQATTRWARVFGGGFLGRVIRDAVERRFWECPERRPRWMEEAGEGDPALDPDEAREDGEDRANPGHGNGMSTGGPLGGLDRLVAF